MSKLMKNSMFTAAILYIIMGLGLIIFKQSAVTAVCYIAGAAGIIYGAIRLFMFFSDTDKALAEGSGMVGGGICFILGLMLVIRTSYIVTVFSVIIGIAIATDSIIKLQNSLDMKRLGQNKWKALLISALVMLAISIILLFDPLKGSEFIAVAMGLALIADAVLNLISVWAVSKAPEKKDQPIF